MQEQEILHFLGKGAAFYPSFDNTSAWFVESNVFYLIDCGESVFSKIWNIPEYFRADKVVVILTHLHCDHVGSLGSLISYTNMILKLQIEIVHENDNSLKQLLKLCGIDETMYTCCRTLPLTSDLSIEAISVKHASNMDCYGYIINKGNLKIYYSGDSYEMPKEVIERFKKREIVYVFHDTCKRENFHHCSLNRLKSQISEDLRKYVWCMHLDCEFEDEIIKSGFNIVEVQ